MKNVLGILLIIIGIIIGAYIGAWILFIGGMIQIIEAIRAEHLIAMDMAIGVVKMMFAGFCGAVSGYVFAIPGYVMLKSR